MRTALLRLAFGIGFVIVAAIACRQGDPAKSPPPNSPLPKVQPTEEPEPSAPPPLFGRDAG